MSEPNGSLDAQLAALTDRYMKIDCSCFTPNNERIDQVSRNIVTPRPRASSTTVSSSATPITLKRSR